MAAVAVVVVNHDRADLLGPCLASVDAAVRAAGVEAEVVLVDNGSSDGSADRVRSAHPSVTVIAWPENRGFPAGVNAGVAATTAPWVLTLNNDATLAPEALGALLAETGEDAVGAVAAQMRFADRPDVINSAGIGVDVLGVAFDRRLGEPADPPGAPVEEVFGASAGAALYRREMLEAVGGFDARFFVYLEDVDLAWRARMAGWRARYVPAAVVLHHHAATARHGSPFKYRHVGANRMRMLARNLDGRQMRRHALAIVAYDCAYVAFVAARERTLAPLLGRLSGLRDWRAYRREGAAARRPVELAPRRGLAAALRRRAAWQGRKDVATP